MRAFEAIFSPEMLVSRDFLEPAISESSEEPFPDPVKRKPKMGWSELFQSFLQGGTEERDTLLIEEKSLIMAKRFVEENYPHVAQRLEGLRHLDMPIGQEAEIRATFDRAYDILYKIARMALSRGVILARPYTFGTPDNGVQYEWRRGGREFHLEIIPKHEESQYRYLLCPSSDPYEGDEGELGAPLDSAPAIKDFISCVEKGLL